MLYNYTFNFIYLWFLILIKSARSTHDATKRFAKARNIYNTLLQGVVYPLKRHRQMEWPGKYKIYTNIYKRCL